MCACVQCVPAYIQQFLINECAMAKYVYYLFGGRRLNYVWQTGQWWMEQISQLRCDGNAKKKHSNNNKRLLLSNDRCSFALAFLFSFLFLFDKSILDPYDPKYDLRAENHLCAIATYIINIYALHWCWVYSTIHSCIIFACIPICCIFSF